MPASQEVSTIMENQKNPVPPIFNPYNIYDVTKILIDLDARVTALENAAPAAGTVAAKPLVPGA